MSSSLFEELRQRLPNITYHHIAAKTRRSQALQSKIQRRVLRKPARVFQFSEKNLGTLSREVTRILKTDDRPAFFKGITPWVGWEPDRPYFIFTDVGFATILENQDSKAQFQSPDLERIFRLERRFLERASAVFFESSWGRERTMESYQLDGENLQVSGRSGLFPAQDQDDFEPGSKLPLVTIAKHFRLKGGDLVQDAYLQLKQRVPDLTWEIVGGEPDFDWKRLPDVHYHGFLHPEKPDDRRRYEALLRKAFLLLHPTREDTNPLVISEAAAFGCPTISVDRFAIPELVDHGVTGFLIKSPAQVAEMICMIESLIEAPLQYQTMRKATLNRAQREQTWGQIAENILTRIQGKLGSNDA